MPKDFKSFLPPKFIRLVEHKLETGELTSDECKSVIKELMLREFNRKQAEQTQSARKALATKIQNRAQTFLNKVLDRAPARSENTMEELVENISSPDSSDHSGLPAISRHDFSSRNAKKPRSLAQ